MIDLSQLNNYGILLEMIGFLLLIPFIRNLIIYYDWWKTTGIPHYHGIVENYETHELPPNTKIKTKKEIFCKEIIHYFGALWNGDRILSDEYNRPFLLKRKTFEKILQSLAILLVLFGLFYQFT